MAIQVNSIVQYRNPNADEMKNGRPVQYIVRELNGDRCFIEAIATDLAYIPTTLAMVADLVEYEYKAPTMTARQKELTNKAIRRIAELMIQTHGLDCTVDEYINRCKK